MSRYSYGIVGMVILLVLALGSTGFAQEPADAPVPALAAAEVPAPAPVEPSPNITLERKNGKIDITIRSEAGIGELLDQMANVIGRPVIYDPRNNRIAKQQLGTTFRDSVPEGRFLDSCRSILAFYELLMVPVGPRGNELYLVLDSRSTNNLIKNKAMPVPYTELEEYADRDGLFITSAIPIRHITNLTTLRTALSSMTSPAGIGRVHEVPGANSLIISDFAPTVVAMARLIREMDVEGPEAALVIEVIELEFARADNVAAALTRVVADWVPSAPVNAQRGRPQYGYGPVTVKPTIVDFEHLNAVIISANPNHVKRLRELIQSLDRPARADEK